MELIRDLCESRLLPTYTHLRHLTAEQVAKTTYVYLLCLQVLRFEEKTWVERYVRRTIQWNNFAQPVNAANDLYVLLHALTTKDQKFAETARSEFFMKHVHLDMPTVLTYLRDIAQHTPSSAIDRKLFVNLDRRLNIWDSGLRAVRRLAMDWPNLSTWERKLTVTRLLQYLRAHAATSEIRPFMEQLAKDKYLEIDDACDAETGENCSDEKLKESQNGFLRSLLKGAK